MSSRNTSASEVDVLSILEQSRHNNAIDGVTGLLYTDGVRFLQVLEGPDESIDQTLARIRRDQRHRDIVVFHDIAIEARQFGSWSMALRRRDDGPDAFDKQMRRILMDAGPTVRDQFLALVAGDEERSRRTG